MTTSFADVLKTELQECSELSLLDGARQLTDQLSALLTLELDDNIQTPLRLFYFIQASRPFTFKVKLTGVEVVLNKEKLVKTL